MERYSTSVEDLATLSYFLHFQEIKLSLKYIHHPVVDLRVFEQPAQSTLEYAFSIKDASDGKNKPRVGV